jgi:group I intron endonuclease
MKKNNNNFISISPPAPPPESVPAITSATSLPSSKSLPESTVSEQFYPNSDICKDQILSDNKNKSGIYMWKNLINKKQYIGSAIDLSERLSCYYSTTYMEDALKRGNSHIYRALLKNGHTNFSVTIIEYCKSEKCIEREDFYLCSLPHEYNILEKAGSRLGSTHSDATKQIMSDAKKGSNHPMYGKNHTEETKTIISEANKGESNPNYGKTRSDETCKKIILSMPTSIKIEVTDSTNNTITSYDSIGEAAKALNINRSNIAMYFFRNQQNPYKGRYIFKKVKF